VSYRKAVNDFADQIQKDVLRAILLDRPSAREAARDWVMQQFTAHGNLDTIESGLHRLLPLLHRQLKGTLDVALERELKEIRHYYWMNNLKLFLQLKRLLNWFAANQIPTLVLKGAALSLLHYNDMSIRPLGDIDVMVPEERVRTAIHRLVAEGWLVEWDPPDVLPFDYFYRFRHAVPLSRRGEGELDLHWQVVFSPTSEDASRVFWDGAVPLVIQGAPTRALNPTDQLFQACVHGYDGNTVTPIRWIADATTIMDTGRIDWDRLVRLSRELHLTIPMSETLSFLANVFDMNIPDEVLTILSSEPISASERRYFQHRRYPGDYSPLEILADLLERHRHCTRDLGLIRRWALLPYALQMHWRLPRLRALGGHGIKWLRRHLRFV